MAVFSNKKSGGFMDEIRCDEQSYLIWKWRPKGNDAGVARATAIRYGSSLRVREGSVAVFVYKQENGMMQEFIEGPYDKKIETKNFPVLASIIGLAYEGGTPFQAEIYFINLARVIQIKFAVPYFDIFDPRFTDFSVPVSARGTISFKIADYKEFIKLHRLDQFDLDDFQRQVRDAVIKYVKKVVIDIPSEYDIPVIQIERKIADINDRIASDIKERLLNDFGVEVSGVDVASLDVNKESEGYHRLMAVTQEITSQTLQAQAAANIKNIHDTQRINMENLEETMRIQREEAQYAQHKQTQGSNFAAYQLEQQAAVGIAGANALGQMGANGAGDMSGGGMNPAAMMAGMAMGGAIGQNMAGMMKGMMSGLNTNVQPQGNTPPPLPNMGYHVVIDGQPAGPYSMSVLSQMVQSGSLTKDSLVWKDGMSEWVKAETVQELQPAFGTVGAAPPPIPNIE